MRQAGAAGPSFLVSTPGDQSWKYQKWTVLQKGLLLQCLLQGYSQTQCAEILEHFFRDRTEGRLMRVVKPLSILVEISGVKNEEGEWHDGSFAAWVRLAEVSDTQVAEINEMVDRWKTIKTHEGVLLDLLSCGFDEHSCARLLQLGLPNPDGFLKTTSSAPSLAARIHEASSRLGQPHETTPLKGAAGWIRKAIEDWVKGWKVERPVAEIVCQLDETMAEELSQPEEDHGPV